MAPHTSCDMPTIHMPFRAPRTHANITSHIQMQTQTARLHCDMALCWPRTLCTACMPHHSQHTSHMHSSTHLLRHAYESHAMPRTTRMHWTATSHLRMTAPIHAPMPCVQPYVPRHSQHTPHAHGSTHVLGHAHDSHPIPCTTRTWHCEPLITSTIDTEAAPHTFHSWWLRSTCSPEQRHLSMPSLMRETNLRSHAHETNGHYQTRKRLDQTNG